VRPSNRISATIRSSAWAASLMMAAGFLLPAAVFADSITLKNGDHLTGTVTQLVGGKLTLTTSYAGAVTITWDQVTNLKLDKSLILPIETKIGKKTQIKDTNITSIERTDSGYEVTTASGPERLPTAAITALRTAEGQQAYEASLNPGWLHAWTGAANVSFALARGNSDTTTLGTGVTLSRPTRTDKTSLYYNEIYTHDGIANSTTANNTAAGARYDHNINPKIFGFVTGDFFTDALQDLDLRTVLGGGAGWHAIAKPNQQFDILAGLVWTHESYSAVPPVGTTPATAAQTNSFAALDFGQQYTRKIGKSSAFTEQAYIFPDLADTSQFRFTLNSGLTTKIASFLSWQTTASDVYVTNPPSGTKDNDFILTTGLGFTFTRK
jgi:putative salt-induced outer membrane protein